MKLADSFGAVPRVEPDLEQRIWGAQTDDHWYLAAVIIAPVACQEVPGWIGFDFAGIGPVGNVNVAWSIRGVLARIGCRLVRLVLRETTYAEYRDVQDAAVREPDG